jgi:arabinoxylan arabinofuranohydrolase
MGLLFAVCLALSPAYGDINLLTNPGFESGTTGWFAFGGCKFKVSTTVYRSGTSSGYAYDRTQPYQGIAQSLLGKMEAGKTYAITGWMKLEGASGSDNTIKATIKKTTADGNSIYTSVSTATGSNDRWTQLSGQYTLTSDGNLTGLDLYFEGPPADVNFYVDDVNVSGPSAPAAPKGNAAIDLWQIKGFGVLGVCDSYQPIFYYRENKVYDRFKTAVT